MQLILIAAVVLIFGSWNTDDYFEIDVNVKFVKDSADNQLTNGVDPESSRRNKVLQTQKHGDFFKEFINSSLAGDSFCFRDGIETGQNSNCKCKFDYHGRDCGQVCVKCTLLRFSDFVLTSFSIFSFFNFSLKFYGVPL